MYVFLKEGITDGCKSAYRYRNARIACIFELFEFHSLISKNAVTLNFRGCDGVFHFSDKTKMEFRIRSNFLFHMKLFKYR